MKKFEVRICHCGRIHFVPWCNIDEAINQNKEFVLICKHCGMGIRYGADDYCDEGKALYCFDLQHNEITKESFDTQFTKILYNDPIPVPMMTGQYADYYDCKTFYDLQPFNWSSKLYECKTIEEIRDYYQQTVQLARKVNVKRLMNALNKEQKESLSHYYIDALIDEKS